MESYPQMRGMSLSVYANQGERDAIVLSAVEKQALVEYVMPEGRTFLRVLQLDENGYIVSDDGRSVSYNAIPLKFMREMRANFSAVLPLLKGGFDADEVAGKKWPLRMERVRLAQRALYTRCNILNLPMPANGGA